MSYVDAFRRGNTICVSERNEKGVRVVRNAPAPFYFYVNDPDGPFKSIYNQNLKRVSSRTYQQHLLKIEQFQEDDHQTFESDIKAEYRFLEDNYNTSKPPKLNIAILDIEADRDREKGFSTIENPYAIINAITIDCKWSNTAVTIVVKPPSLSMDEAVALVEDIENTIVVATERELLLMMLDVLDDADIISGWNSAFYDLPMIVQRIRVCLGNEDINDVGNLEEYNVSDESRQYLSRLCLFNEIPVPRKVSRWGADHWTFHLFGKVHLDYLELYQKFTFEELHSYALDYILALEIDENKVEYTGSLDDLWKNDFYTFTLYNRQDTVGLSKVDDKRKFITLANEMAHTACVPLKDTLGSVTIIEHAILCELHKRNRIAPDKSHQDKEGKVAGAFVKLPEGGMYEWITSFDINSLYPSVIRMLNISPETVVGQMDLSRTMIKINNLIESKKARSSTEAWHHFTGVLEYHDIQEAQDDEVTLILEDGDRITQTGAEWRDWFMKNEFAISANGTVFDTSEEGIIPFCLKKWYNERVEFKRNAKEAIKNGDDAAAEYWDTIQQARKLFLNSTYGALLNEWFRFYDTRFGQSVTLSGRVVTKHMIRKASELIDGKYEFGKSAIYSDTDSVYMTMTKLINDDMKLEDIVAIADEIGKLINESFPAAMMNAFFVPYENGAVIQSGREVVARRGIFKDKTKKRYALHVLDNEGAPSDKLKIMGMETQRSDTPKWIQQFLEECLKLIVQEGKGEDKLVEKIIKFRKHFFEKNVWELGSPKRIKNLKNSHNEMVLYENNLRAERPLIYYTVGASMNFNTYLEYFDDKDIPPIRDGDKVEIMYLNEKDLTHNPFGFRNIAIPVGLKNKSEWIQNLPFNVNRAYNSLVTQKLNNIFDMFDWEFEPPDTTAAEVFDW